MDANAHCLDLVRGHDKDRFIASLFAPDNRRPALLALYAFDIEVGRIAGAVSEPMLGAIRLQWWHDALQGMAAGGPADHPVVEALGAALRNCRLPLAPFLDLLVAHEHDLHAGAIATTEALEAYLGRTSSAVIQLASLILAGDAARTSAEAAGLAGVALGLARLLHRQALGDASAARLLPPDLPPDAARAHAVRRLDEARRLRATIHPAALPAFLPVAMTEPYLTTPPRRIAPLRRQLRLWWNARRNRF